jgi:predicted AlkP superfamily pyrophosphatase or phosphodiesterase
MRVPIRLTAGTSSGRIFFSESPMPKLLCVVIDGLRAETLACAHVRCFDHLIRNGVIAQQVQPLQPDLTLPTLVSLFTSLPPEEHGVLTNSGASMISPQAVSLFSLLRYRNLNSSVFYSNDSLRLLFPTGSLHTGVFINSQGIRNVDRELAEQASRHLQKEKPDLCLLYLQGADIAGVHFGFLSEAYLESVEQADQSLGLLLEYLAVVGLQQDYVIMVLGCHGASRPRIGEELPAVNRLPLIIAGPGIPQEVELEQPLSFWDLAPTMAKILGLAPHPDWRGSGIDHHLHRPPLELMVREHKKTAKQRQEGLAA